MRCAAPEVAEAMDPPRVLSLGAAGSDAEIPGPHGDDGGRLDPG
jgi:hypothetical protein